MNVMITQEFRKLYDQLNAEQREVVEAIEGPVMVVAGPGTGKTQVLTLRIANILARTDTQADSILALTFTESGAHACLKRLVSIIGPAAYRVGIFTFHGFCNDIIKSYPEEFPRVVGSVNITPIEQLKVVKGVITKLKLKKLKPYGDNFYYLKPVIKAISDCKRENNLPQPDSDKNREFLKIYHEYQKELEKNKQYDYDDMILETLRVLKRNKNLLLQLQEQYQYILADEHQDANSAQNQLLELLASYYDNPNIFIVGDDRQAIFRFQGASINNFQYFKNRYKKVKLITLKTNYRSHQKILDAAGTGLKALPLGEGRGGVELYAFSKPDVENYFVARDVRHRMSNNIAILYRDNRDAAPLTRALERAGVPHVVESDQNILEDEDIGKLLLILRAVNDPLNEELFAKVLHVDFLNINPSDAYRYIKSKE